MPNLIALSLVSGFVPDVYGGKGRFEGRTDGVGFSL